MTKLIELPHSGFLRIWHIIGTHDTPGLIPVCKSTWWEGVRSGRFPKPVRIGKRAVAWRASDITELIQSFDATLEVDQ
jgi:prophage regulatory protein